MQDINNKLADIVKALGGVLDKLDTLAEQNAQIIGLLTDIKTNTKFGLLTDIKTNTTK